LVTETGEAVPAVDVGLLFARHRGPLIRLAVMLVDDMATAEDVVQDAFAGLQRHRGALRSVDAVTGYLRRAVVNNAHSVLRRRRTARLYRWPDPTDDAGADVEFELAEQHRDVLDAVRTLPPRQREVIVLRYWLGLSEEQIAQTLNISRGGVKSQASRAVHKVKIYLEAKS
jgi:RNA polymerase sigma-70 factor (sigma-E family)